MLASKKTMENKMEGSLCSSEILWFSEQRHKHNIMKIVNVFGNFKKKKKEHGDK